MDEFWFWVSPSLWPAGPRIFDGVGPVRLELIGSGLLASALLLVQLRDPLVQLRRLLQRGHH